MIKTKDKIRKVVTDFVMIAGLIGCAVSTSVFEESKKAIDEGASVSEIFHWGTSHCIISILFVVIIFVHILQHWNFIKAIVSKKRYLKNKLTTVTMVLFILTVVSFTLYLSGFTPTTLHLHSLIAHLFVLFAIIHLVMNFKKLFALMKKDNGKVTVSD